MVIDIVLIVVGIVLVLWGADRLTDGAVAVAQRLRIPEMVIGLTIVGLGTSMPELCISLVSALKGTSDLAVGNVVGSNIFNIFGIIGCTALFSPIVMTRGNVIRDLPIMVGTQVILFLMLIDKIISGAAKNELTRGDGLILLCLFSMFLYYTVRLARKGRKAELKNAEDRDTTIKPWWMAFLLIVVGLACLILGGNWMVDGASGIARFLGVSEAIIALTIVSIGTSAPELATSIMAARKGDNDMAVGNIVGSVVFNTLLILGASATVFPLPMEGITMTDLYTLLVAAFLFWGFGWMGKNHYIISRVEGVMLVLLQVAYYVYLIYKV